MFETYQLRKTVQGEGKSQSKCQIQNVNATCQGQSRAKGQIHLIGYNIASNCQRDFKLGSCFNLWKAVPNMTLTLTFDLDHGSLPKVEILETYKLRKTVKGEGESQPKRQIH